MSNLTSDEIRFYSVIFVLLVWLIYQIINTEIRHEWQIKQEGNKFTPQKKIFKRWSILNETINYVNFDTLESADLFIEENKHIPKVTIHKR